MTAFAMVNQGTVEAKNIAYGGGGTAPAGFCHLNLVASSIGRPAVQIRSLTKAFAMMCGFSDNSGEAGLKITRACFINTFAS